MTLHRLRALYRRHFHDHRRERMFIASLCFLLTFAIARLLTQLGRSRANPFRLELGGVHVHHLVFGILLLLAVGYMWLIQVGTGHHASTIRMGRLTALLYGVGAALTLDEFALWLRLRDIYWEREGRASIDAVVLFGALVSAGLWGGPFLRALARQLSRPFRRRVAKALDGLDGTVPLVPGSATPVEDLLPPAPAPVEVRNR